MLISIQEQGNEMAEVTSKLTYMLGRKVRSAKMLKLK